MVAIATGLSSITLVQMVLRYGLRLCPAEEHWQSICWHASSLEYGPAQKQFRYGVRNSLLGNLCCRVEFKGKNSISVWVPCAKSILRETGWPSQMQVLDLYANVEQRQRRNCLIANRDMLVASDR